MNRILVLTSTACLASLAGAIFALAIALIAAGAFATTDGSATLGTFGFDALLDAFATRFALLIRHISTATGTSFAAGTAFLVAATTAAEFLIGTWLLAAPSTARQALSLTLRTGKSLRFGTTLAATSTTADAFGATFATTSATRDAFRAAFATASTTRDAIPAAFGSAATSGLAFGAALDYRGAQLLPFTLIQNAILIRVELLGNLDGDRNRLLVLLSVGRIGEHGHGQEADE